MVTPKLPSKPTNNQEVVDNLGNRYMYDAINNCWIFRGKELEAPIVTESINGLVNPTIFNRIRYLRNLSTNNLLSPTLKIRPGEDAYWYYWRSPDKLYRFQVEGPSKLRIEIDRGRLHQLFARICCCIGERGDQGPCGPDGTDGTPGSTESFYKPTETDGSRLDFFIKIPLPLDTDVSLRLFNAALNSSLIDQDIDADIDLNIDPSPIAELVVDECPDPCVFNPAIANVEIHIPSAKGGTENPEPVIITDEAGIDLERSVIILDSDQEVIYGSIYLTNGTWGNDWFIKVRQRGPRGEAGRDATAAACITQCDISDPTLPVECPLVSVRLDCANQNLYFLRECFDKPCATQLSFNQAPGFDQLDTGDVFRGMFAAAETTLSTCKQVLIFKPEVEFIDRPPLELVDWVPQSECPSKRNYCKSLFDWIPLTQSGGGVWDRLNGPTSAAYPFDIINPVEPDEQCCQDDLFYCNNANEEDPCGPFGSIPNNCGPISNDPCPGADNDC